MRAALVSPRVTGVSLAPSWAAVERVLWLAALDRCLRATPGDSARVLIAPIYHPPHRPLVGRGDRRGAPLLGARGAAGGAVVSLRVLTVWQPWATLLVRGIKGPENRGWEPRGLK